MTQDRGWGLFTKANIKMGDFIIEYVGELITMEEYHRRLQDCMTKKEEMNCYYMMMDNHRMIDAGPKGNIARFMNHSCDPNCETQKWTVNGDTRVGLFASKDITAGIELTFNYQFEAVGEIKKACYCGAQNCSGWIGEKLKELNCKNGHGSQAETNATPAARKKKKKKLNEKQKIWENLCFLCFDVGKLLMCDHKTCPKVYHLECLGLKKMPREKWFCPWRK
jgi:histone-lysine N-methyltransferase NSD2